MRISSRTVGRAERTSSVCQRAVISASRSCSRAFSWAGGDGDAVELLEQVGDAAALEHDAAARDLGGVGGEDGRDADAGSLWSASERRWPASAQRRRVPRRLPRCGTASSSSMAGEAAALAVVGLGEVDELEVEGEGARELVGKARHYRC
jgi:hypothetical protein